MCIYSFVTLCVYIFILFIFIFIMFINIYWLLMTPVMTFLILIHQLMVGLRHFKLIQCSSPGLILHQVASDLAPGSLGDDLVNFPWKRVTALHWFDLYIFRHNVAPLNLVCHNLPLCYHFEECSILEIPVFIKILCFNIIFLSHRAELLSDLKQAHNLYLKKHFYLSPCICP